MNNLVTVRVCRYSLATASLDQLPDELTIHLQANQRTIVEARGTGTAAAVGGSLGGQLLGKTVPVRTSTVLLDHP